MQEKTIKMGDRVAWRNVPNGTLVRDDEGDYALRVDDLGSWVSLGGGWDQWDSCNNWSWSEGGTEQGVIVALNVDKETDADVLEMFAKIALHVEYKTSHRKVTALQAAVTEIEAEAEKCHAAAAVCPDVADAIECEARAGGLERALEILREAGTT